MELRRYNTRHDEVLSVITGFVKKQVPSEMTVTADLSDNNLFPPSLTLTDLRLDIVAYDIQAKTTIILELTVSVL